MKPWQIALAFTLLILAACEDNKDPISRSEFSNPEWDSSLSQKAQLIDKVPEDAAMYLRIPSIWGFLFSPKGNGLHNALASTKNQKQIALFQKQLKTQLKSLGDEIAKPLDGLLYQLRSPLEIVMLLPEGAAITSSKLVLSAQLNFDGLQPFNQFITELSQSSPMINLTREATAEKPGLINLGPAKLYFSFNEKTKIFTAISGMAVFDDDLTNVNKWQTVSKPTPLKTLEQQIDQSGQGLFGWVNFQRFRPLIEPNIPAPKLNAMIQSGALQTESIAFGEGVANGKGNFSFIATGTSGLIWESAFNHSELPQIMTAGIPEYAIGLQIVDKIWLNKVIREIAELQPTADEKEAIITKWINANTEVKQSIGLTIEDILDAVAGQWLSVADEAGRYTMLVPTHANALTDFLSALEKQNHIQIREIRSNSTSIQEISFSFTGIESSSLPAALARVKSRVYLQKEQGYFLLSDIPQVFIARKQLNSSYSLNKWLKENSLSNEGNMFWAGMTTSHIPRDNYHAYLSYFQLIFGDLLDLPVTIENFPTAEELQLPKLGTQGFSWNYSKGQIGMSMSYDSHPGEFLMGGNAMAGVAIIGILAAVAIPAYQDYTKRAKLSSVITSTYLIKQQLAAYYSQHNSWPVEDLETFKSALSSEHISNIWFDKKQSSLVIELNLIIDYNFQPTLIFTPTITNNTISWKCSSPDIPNKYLPSSCRADY